MPLAVARRARHGLTRYLREVEAQGNIDHVLLVGGSSYDHTDRLGTGAMTFIPGHYGQSGYSNYTVTDTPYITDSRQPIYLPAWAAGRCEVVKI